ncbi:MAG: hypothetical protein ACR2GX_09800 [Candidatus Dormibacteria bacterium]
MMNQPLDATPTPTDLLTPGGLIDPETARGTQMVLSGDAITLTGRRQRPIRIIDIAGEMELAATG